MRNLNTILLLSVASILVCPAIQCQTVEEAVDIFMRSPFCSQFKISPDGSHVAMILHGENSNRIATLNLETQEVHSAKGMAGQNITRYAWVDGDNILFNVNLWSIYFVGMFATDQDLRDYNLLGETYFVDQFNTYFSKTMLSVIDPLPSVPNKALLADRSDNDRFRDTIYYNFESDRLFGREQNRSRITRRFCDQEGDVRIVGRLGAPGETIIEYLLPEENEWVTLSLGSRNSILAYDSNREILFNSFLNEQKRIAFQMFDLKKMEYFGNQISHPDFACSPDILLDRQTNEVVGVVYELDKPRVVYFHPDYKKLHDFFGKIFPDATIKVLGANYDGSKILLEARSDTTPMRIYSVDLNAEKKEEMFQLIVNQAGWIDPEVCSKVSPVTFQSRDGKTIHGYVTRSSRNAGGPGPTVMLVHGGPSSRDKWGFNYMVQYLAYLGYNVVQVNYRGSKGFNANYSIRKLTRVCNKVVEDVADGARWAISEGIADPDRIAIMGGSFGGYAALAGAAFEPDLYKVAIGTAGVYNFDRQLKNDLKGENSDMRTWLSPFIGDIEEFPELYQTLSPVNHADKIRAKVLLTHGGADNVVAASQSKSMKRLLDSAGVEAQLHLSAWGIHGFYNEKDRKKYGTLIGEFLRDNL